MHFCKKQASHFLQDRHFLTQAWTGLGVAVKLHPHPHLRAVPSSVTFKTGSPRSPLPSCPAPSLLSSKPMVKIRGNDHAPPKTHRIVIATFLAIPRPRQAVEKRKNGDGRRTPVSDSGTRVAKMRSAHHALELGPRLDCGRRWW